MRVAGIFLLIIGIIMVAINGINWKTKEKVVDLGPVEINKEKEHSIGWPMYLGGAILVGGIVLMVAGKKD